MADKSDFELRQEYLAGMRAMMAQTGAGYIYTGPATVEGGGNAAAYLPNEFDIRGLPVPELALHDFEFVTGLKWVPGAGVPKLIDVENGAKAYAWVGKAV